MESTKRMSGNIECEWWDLMWVSNRGPSRRKKNKKRRGADPSGLETKGGVITATAADQPAVARNGERSGSRWTPGTTLGSLTWAVAAGGWSLEHSATGPCRVLTPWALSSPGAHPALNKVCIHVMTEWDQCYEEMECCAMSHEDKMIIYGKCWAQCLVVSKCSTKQQLLAILITPPAQLCYWTG